MRAMELTFDKNKRIGRFAHSNKLIEARYNLSLPQQRLVLLMASMITPKDEDFKSYRIRIRDFADLFNIKGDSIIERVKDAAKELISKPLTIKEDNSTLICSWISSFFYEDGKGYVNLCFDPKLKPYLLQLKERYTFLESDDLIQLRSAYSIRIYMLLKQCVSIGHRTFGVQELRHILGIQNDEYERFYDFKTHIIAKSAAEISDKTDLTITFKSGAKTGKLWNEVIFKIIRKEKNEEKGSLENEKKNEEKGSKFENEFWINCPLQKNKKKSQELFEQIITQKPELEDKIIGAMKAYKKKTEDPKFDRKFIKHPNNWLRDENYSDSDLFLETGKQISPEQIAEGKKWRIASLQGTIRDSFEFKNKLNSADWQDFKDLKFDFEDDQPTLYAGDKKEFLGQKYSNTIKKFNLKLI